MKPDPKNIINPIPPVLDVLRKDIDWIDDQILDLLEQRYAVVKRVAWAKTREGEQVLAVRPAREAEILKRLVARAIHVPEADVARVWRAILSLSAHYQRAYRVLVSGPEEARAALLVLAALRHPGATAEWVGNCEEAARVAARGEAILLVAADQWDDAGEAGLDLLGQHATGCLDHPWALELGHLGRHVRSAEAGWSPQSWRTKVHRQLPAYPDERKVRQTEQELADRAGIVPLDEVLALRTLVAEAQDGRGMLIQAGDCAEPIDAGQGDVRASAALVSSLADEFEASSGAPVIRLGRLGGQYAKPRSRAVEGGDGERLAVYRGDMVNGRRACAVERAPDPARLLQARDQAERVRRWLGAGAVHLSHEALLLPYEAALTRTIEGVSWASSAHSLWLGERTRDIAGAHVEYLRGLANPLGVKCGPSLTADELLRLLDRLDPDHVPGRIMLVPRLGATLAAQRLPALMAAVRSSARPVLWLCDPMHGNNRAANGTKLRLMADIKAEVQAFVRGARQAGVHPGGLHLEVTPRPVLECVDRMEEAAADRPFESLCDPRLNAAQAGAVVAAYAAALRECAA